MVRLSGGLLLLSTVFAAAKPTFRDTPATSDQLVLDTARGRELQPVGNGRKLKGKFLHITDFHPDPYYKIGASPKSPHPCHQGQGNTIANFYGAPTTECDSPFTLVEATFRWVKENVKDNIDFVIWTGDSARHDNDNDIPRSDDQVLELNQYIASQFVDVFGNPDPNSIDKFIIPIVPTLGNNDILPHNIFGRGPNRWSEEFAEIWEQFIPQDEVHTFARGGWFSVEVIPDKLAVINLNTLYFFSSNAAVDGCERESEPGYEHFEWLRVQLQDLRERSMKAYLIGHVPPARTKGKKNWDETCYQKYILWHKQFRDVIVANFYGHMNIDHFIFHDTQDIQYRTDSNQMGVEFSELDDSTNSHSDEEIRILGKEKYLNSLKDTWSDLPTPPKGMTYNMPVDDAVKMTGRSKRAKKFLQEVGGPYAERFTMSIVSPSVVPNYFPTLRLVEYNITGMEDDEPAMVPKQPRGRVRSAPWAEGDYRIDGHGRNPPKSEDEMEDEFRMKVKEPKWPRKPTFQIPDPPSSTSLPGPAHSPQTLSLVSWTQMFANLTEIHEKMMNDGVSLAELSSQNSSRNLYKYFNYTIEYKTDDDDVYNLPDLTVRSWLTVGERIGRLVYQSTTPVLTEDAQNSSWADGEYVYDHGQQQQDEYEEDENEDEEDGDEDGDGNEADLLDDEVGITKKGKHKKHKKKKHKHEGSGKLGANHLWHGFLRRAYVGSKRDKWLKKHFD